MTHYARSFKKIIYLFLLFACIANFLRVWATSLSAFTMSAHHEIIWGQICQQCFILQYKYSEFRKTSKTNKKQATHTKKPPNNNNKKPNKKRNHNQSMVLNYKHSFSSDSWLGEAQR